MKRPALKAALSLAVTNKPMAEVASERGRAETRIGRKQIAGWFAPEVSRQLRQIALDEDSSVQRLLTDALNDVFAKRGKPRIA
jgi:hypothetical protein